MGGIGIGVLESLVLKICAVCGQYGIGYFMGKSTKVRQMVGVDKALIRAIERILQVRGLKLPKVSILVGGPDWPTSVLCGIMKLSLFQCCLGTLPVVIVSAPCVIAGALLAGPKSNMSEADKSFWQNVATAGLGVSTIGQLASGCLAMQFTQDTLSKNADEFSKPRPEDDDVRRLTLAEREFNECYEQVTSWRAMSKWKLLLIASSTGAMIFSNGCFIMMEEACFRTIQTSDKITDPEGFDCPPGSLACGLIGLLIFPVGYGALFWFVYACITHFAFLKMAGRMAKAELARRKGTSGSSPKSEQGELVQTRL